MLVGGLIFGRHGAGVENSKGGVSAFIEQEAEKGHQSDYIYLFALLAHTLANFHLKSMCARAFCRRFTVV